MATSRVLVGAALAVSLTAAPSFGDIITFIHTGSGSGTINGVPFGNSEFTITSVADTANRQDLGFGFFIDHTTSSIEISGLGVLDVLTPTRTFVNNGGQIVGYSRAGFAGLDLYNGPSNAAFGAWDMTTSIGPIPGTCSLLQWGDNPLIDTDHGNLRFDDAVVDGTFTAVIPAPLSLSLLGGAAIGLAVRRRR